MNGLDETNAEPFFQRVLASFQHPFETGGHQVKLGASLGVALGSPNISEGLDAADDAMYEAKERGGGVEIRRV